MKRTMTLGCPKCTSTELRKLSLIFNEGRATVNAQRSATAVDLGGVPRATATAAATGRQQAALSKQAAPPQKKRWVAWSILAVVCIFGALGNIGSPGVGTVIAIVIAVLAIGFAIIGRRYNTEVHPELLRRWERSFMCNRCGEVFAAD